MRFATIPAWLTTLVFLCLWVWVTPPPRALCADPPLELRADGWTEIFNSQGIIVQTQAMEGRSLKAYRAKGILRAPITQILEVLSDSATAADWIPDLAHQEVIGQGSAFEQVTRSVYAVPFPFADRELILHNRLWLDREQDFLVAEAVSIDHPQAPVGKGQVRARMERSQIRLRPLAGDQTRIEFLMVVDPRGRIPAFLTDYGLRRAPFKFVRALEARAQTAGYPLRPAFGKLLTQLGPPQPNHTPQAPES